MVNATIKKSPTKPQISGILFKHSLPTRMILCSKRGTLSNSLDAHTAYSSRSLIPPNGAGTGSKLSS